MAAEPIQCFLLTRTDRVLRHLRRLAWQDCTLGTNKMYHEAMTFLDEVQLPSQVALSGDNWDRLDPRWPWQCGCGYVFQEKDQWQVYGQRLWSYGSEDDLRFTTLHDAPPGAMYYADHMIQEDGWYKGPDGHCLAIKIPGNHWWFPDARAKNCTKPKDNRHRCWVRRGFVPLITIDKQGETCKAGAGSILTDKWHGHLKDGLLIEC